MSRRAKLVAATLVGLCLVGYGIFHHSFKSDAVQLKSVDTNEEQAKKLLARAIGYLKENDYAAARTLVVQDYSKFKESSVYSYSAAIQQERSIYNYCLFMLTGEDDPVAKYTALQAVTPIEGVITDQQLDKLLAEWKPKSTAASEAIRQQKEDALSGLSEEEKLFVVLYVQSTANGKTPDPFTIAMNATNGTTQQAKKKAEEWMSDSRIVQAVKAYSSLAAKASEK